MSTRLLEEVMRSIQRAKPDLKEISLVNYTKNIMKLKDAVDPIGPDNLDFLNNVEAVQKWLSSKSISTQKNYISTVVVVLRAHGDMTELLDRYVKILGEYFKKMRNTNMQQEKSKKEEKNWTSMSSLVKIRNNIKAGLSESLKKEKLNSSEFFKLQEYVVASLYTMQAPPRNDVSLVIVPESKYNKLNDEQLKDNYLVIKTRNKKFFSYGEYKTSKTYGIKKFDVNPELNSVINLWLKFNKTGYLLLNNRLKRISSNSITKLLNRVFAATGKQIGSTMIRHIYLTERYKPESLEKAKDSDAMMHSISTQTTYLKR
jgi:hypothetical protein